MPTVRSGPIELSYERGGSGPPLLLIMGMSGTFLHWGAELLDPLRRDFDVIVYDHRGVGASSRVSEPFTIADLAADAAGLLQALAVDRAHVVGFSMGGMVAQELVLGYPTAVSTLVLASTYCGGEGSTAARRGTIDRLGAAMRSGDRQAALEVAWEVNVAPRFRENEAARSRFLAIARERRVALAVVMEQMRAIAAHDTSTRLPSVSNPTLVVHGTADGMVPVENAAMIAALVPGAGLELLADAGHLFFWEEPERAARLIRDHALPAADALAVPADHA